MAGSSSSGSPWAGSSNLTGSNAALPPAVYQPQSGAAGQERNRDGKRRRQQDDNPDVKLSKKLSGVLRHKAESLGLEVQSDGFIRLADVLRTPGFSGISVDRIRQLVANNSKQRFSLAEDAATGELLIRANQGHSMSCIDEAQLLRRLNGPEELPACVVHGTYGHAWETIKRDGLKRMARTHVHMARGLPGDGGVISGMRTTAHIAVYIDAQKAMQDGLEFFESTNGVILCQEVPPKYFASAVDLRSGENLDL